MSTDPKSLTTQWFEQVWNQKNVVAIDQLGDPHMTGHGLLPPDDPSTGIARFKKFHKNFLTTFPDLHLTITHLLAENDLVAARLNVTATHSGPGMGNPTHRKVSLSCIAIIQWKNQKIIEAWNEFDRQSLQQQIT